MRFFVRNEGEGLVRCRGSELAYLRAYGWVRSPRQRRLRSILEGNVSGDPRAVGWKECTSEEAAEYALCFFNDEKLDATVLGRWQRLKAYAAAQGLSMRRQSVPHGPAPWRVSREIQRCAQKLQVAKLDIPSKMEPEDLDGLIAQAREGYEQEQSRIDGIQQRASFFLGATGLTTTAVLVNGGLLYGHDELHPAGMRIAVGVLLTIATVALAVAGYAGLQATMVMFDRARPNSPWQIERRIWELDREEEAHYLLGATLLATQRAEAVGDWKIHQLKRARQWFAGAILSVVFASLGLLVAALLF